MRKKQRSSAAVMKVVQVEILLSAIVFTAAVAAVAVAAAVLGEKPEVMAGVESLS